MFPPRGKPRDFHALIIMTRKKVLDAAQTIVDYCKEQPSCQNCIFREYSPEHWECYIQAFDIQDVLCNIKSKQAHHGFV